MNYFKSREVNGTTEIWSQLITLSVIILSNFHNCIKFVSKPGQTDPNQNSESLTTKKTEKSGQNCPERRTEPFYLTLKKESDLTEAGEKSLFLFTKWLSVNDVTAVPYGKGSRILWQQFIKLTPFLVWQNGRGQKNVQKCVTSLIDDPFSIVSLILLLGLDLTHTWAKFLGEYFP